MKGTSVHFCSVLARNLITPAPASWSLSSELLARSLMVPRPYTMASVFVRGSATERRSIRGAGKREREGERRDNMACISTFEGLLNLQNEAYQK